MSGHIGFHSLPHRKVHGYGWRRDTPDIRDRLLRMQVIASQPAESDVFVAHNPPVYDQGQLGSCHDADTDVLTDTGWKRFADLNGSERLASVDPVSSRLIFEMPTRLIRFPYKGKVYCADNRYLNFRVTPDHMMLVRPWDESKRTLRNEYQFVPAKDIGWYCGLMNRVDWRGEAHGDTFTLPGVDHKHIPQRSPRDVPLASWLRFLGVYCAEGTMLKPSEWTKYKIQIAAFKEREKDFVRNTLSEIGVRALELGDRFTFENRQIYECLASMGLQGVRAGQKFVPSFVFRQSAAMIREFLAGHFAGDGSEQNGMRAHYTSSFRLADDLHALIFLSGQETKLTVRAARQSIMADGRTIIGSLPEHRVSVCERKNLSVERKKQIATQDYDGEVFCAEVPTYHTLVTRRAGTVLISGNCTGNGIACALQFERMRQNLSPNFIPSRLFIYYCERAIEGTVSEDAGAEIRDGIKAVARLGAPPETDWPYDIAKFADKPTAQSYKDALADKALTYYRVSQNLSLMKSCLVAGFPFVIGFSVYESFESDQVAQTGVVPMPKTDEQLLGGHCMVVHGHDDKARVFKVRNSWGNSWGQNGNCTMPYQYLTNANLASDFWTIRLVEAPKS